jgi:hypothetical protein
MTRRVVCGLAGLAASLAFAPAQAATVYSNDFEAPAVGTSPGAEWSANTEVNVTPTGRKFLGGTGDASNSLGLGNETATLSLGGLGLHDTVTVSFDAYIINSWDGAAGNGDAGPDEFRFISDGTTRLDTTFSNVNEFGRTQNYPNATGGATVPAHTGAAEVDTLGYSFFGSTVYALSFTFAHTGGGLTLDWLSLGLQGLTDESWGIDNLVVSTSCVGDCAPPTTTPEPASLALLGLGLAGFAALRRRRT